MLIKICRFIYGTANSPMFISEVNPSAFKKTYKIRRCLTANLFPLYIKEEHQISPMFNGEVNPSVYNKNHKTRRCSTAKKFRLYVRRTPNLADVHRRSYSVCKKSTRNLAEVIPSVYKKNTKYRRCSTAK